MNEQSFSFKNIARVVNSLSCFIMLLIIIFLLFKYEVFKEDYTNADEKPINPLTANYNTSGLDDSKENKSIKYGFQLFQKNS